MISEEIGVNKNVSKGFYYNGEREGQRGEKLYGVDVMKDKELNLEENDEVSHWVEWGTQVQPSPRLPPIFHMFTRFC